MCGVCVCVCVVHTPASLPQTGRTRRGTPGRSRSTATTSCWAGTSPRRTAAPRSPSTRSRSATPRSRPSSPQVSTHAHTRTHHTHTNTRHQHTHTNTRHHHTHHEIARPSSPQVSTHTNKHAHKQFCAQTNLDLMCLQIHSNTLVITTDLDTHYKLRQQHSQMLTRTHMSHT